MAVDALGQVFRDFISPGVDYPQREVGFYIRSVEIDNPTGQWLLIKESQIRIPPYTINWRINIQPAARTIAIDATNAPTGFSRTTAGSPIRLVCRDYEIDPSQGVSMIPHSPITRFAVDFDQASFGGNSGLHIPAAATERIKLYQTVFSYNGNPIRAGAALIPAHCILSVTGFGEWQYLNINAQQPTTIVEYGALGVDFEAGADINYSVLSNSVGGIEVNITSVYTLL